MPKMKISKQSSLTIVFAVALSAGLPNIGHAATYSLDVASNGSILASPVGSVNITDTGTTLTYQFSLTSGTLSAVYMDVGGNVSGVTNGFGTSNLGSTTNALGTFLDTFNKPVLQQGNSTLTVTFTGSNLVADYTLLGGIQIFSAANTSNGLIGDTPPAPTTPLPAALPLFAGGLGMLGLLSRRKKAKKAVAIVAA